ncbi:MAG: hypothetical protein KDC38_18675, partial [Planctomycetes bacterium]|nr:hypothetical protein [Planctomycetota bacterium]
GPIEIDQFVLTPPKEWLARRPSSSMRKAELVMPGSVAKEGKERDTSQDATTVLYYFGAGGAGSVDANLARWAGQVKTDDTKPEEERIRRSHKKVHGLAITVIELEGTYEEPQMGPAPAKAPMPDAMMLAAVIETPSGAYYVKTVGPAKTVQKWKKVWHSMLEGIEPKAKRNPPKGS